ncbi:hypothetical protein [Desulfoglaeba alkanexedens]|jgi:predicted DNA binding CopG/RHH family protein|uniref:Antitoxin n=1 Tax=Desulfoglaeba alkanexedens ALDC TaxID=980445 RepID=A0A4P8L295_9BACT|nr:hypothetical protein [Desulfoglaeba alkanexedens]QCQ20852.1 hypothetical protein FDQ92_00740 [Desulfoglaeba alkanexedens ALDC]
MKTEQTTRKTWAEYYDQENILDEITEEPVTFSLQDDIRQDIITGKRKRKLKNISIKLDPLHVQAIKKLATMKAMPYQTLVRHWLAEDIKKELDAVRK